MTSKLELSAPSSEATALAEVWNARQRSNAGGVLLRELSVTNANLTKHFVAKVFRGKSWPNLERLYLQNNSLSDDGVEMLATCIAEGWLPALHTLNVARNFVGNTGAVALADLLIHKKNSLRNLYLYENRIGDLGAEALAQCCISTLNGNPLRKLRELFIWGNNLSEAGKDKLCRARYDGLLMWIDLTAQSAPEDLIKPNKVKNGSKSQARISTLDTSVKELSAPLLSARQSKNMVDYRGDGLCEIGNSSFQHISRKPVQASNDWTPRRTSRSLSQDFLKTRLSASTIPKATAMGRDPIAPKQSSNLVMVPSSPHLSRTRKGKNQETGNTAATPIPPSLKGGHRMSIPLETKPGLPGQCPYAPTDDQSFRFADLLFKTRAMDSPACGQVEKHHHYATTKQQDIQTVTCEANSHKSPEISINSLKKTNPRTKESSVKMAKPEAQVSPTSPVGEYIETTLRLRSQTCSLTDCLEGTSSFQAVLQKARSLDRRNPPPPVAPKDSRLPVQKTLQVPFFVPDLEGSDAMEHGRRGPKVNHPAAMENPQRAKPKLPSPQTTVSPSFHQIRNHFETKSSADGKC